MRQSRCIASASARSRPHRRDRPRDRAPSRRPGLVRRRTVRDPHPPLGRLATARLPTQFTVGAPRRTDGRARRRLAVGSASRNARPHTAGQALRHPGIRARPAPAAPRASVRSGVRPGRREPLRGLGSRPERGRRTNRPRRPRTTHQRGSLLRDGPPAVGHGGLGRRFGSSRIVRTGCYTPPVPFRRMLFLLALVGATGELAGCKAAVQPEVEFPQAPPKIGTLDDFEAGFNRLALLEQDDPGRAALRDRLLAYLLRYIDRHLTHDAGEAQSAIKYAVTLYTPQDLKTAPPHPGLAKRAQALYRIAGRRGQEEPALLALAIQQRF